MKETKLRVLAVYKGTGGRCTEDENILTPRFEISPAQIAKSVRAIAYWLEKPIVVKIKREKGSTIGRARGELLRVDARGDGRSTWTFAFAANDLSAITWMAEAYRTNLVLTLRRTR